MLLHDPVTAEGSRRIVVLGAAGFVGRYLVAELGRRGNQVLALTSQGLDLSQAGAATRLTDLLRPSDAVVMLSAAAHRKRRDTDTLMRNLAIGETVCRALARIQCAQVIYLSSDSVYPYVAAPVDEATPAAPTYLYAAMHATREIMFRDAVRTRLAILRPTQIYGAGDTHNAYGPNRMLRSAMTQGRIELFGAGEETRDHLLIDDLVTLLIHVLQNGSAGLVNLASGQSISFAEIAKKIVAQIDRPIEIVSVPRQLPDITHRQFDISALRATFPGFAPTPLDDGLARMLAQLESPAITTAAVS